MRKLKVIIAVLAVIQVSNIFAEAGSGDVKSVDEVIITASRKEKNVQDVPVSVVIVDGEDVRETPVQSVAEVLRDIPGIEISTTASNGMKYVSIRGEGSSRTLLLVDGQPLSLQKSMDGPMALIGASQIERIEVVKGPVSVLYGSEAIGGVVNIITKKGGEKPFGGSLNYSYDSATRGFRGDNVVNGNINGIEYTFTYGLSRYDDTETPDGTLDSCGNSTATGDDRVSGTGSESDEYSAYLGYKNKKVHTGAKVEVYKSEYEVYTDPEELGFPSGPVQDMSMDIPESDRTKGSAFIKLFDLNDFITVVSLDTYYQHTERDFDIFMDYYMFQNPPGTVVMDYTSQTATHNEQNTIGVNFQSDFAFGPHYIVSGLDFKRDDIDGTEKSYTYKGDVVPSSKSDEKYAYDSWINTYALFLQDEWEILDNLSVTAGGRYTFVSSELVDTDDPTMVLEEGDSTDWNLSFSLASIYHITDDLSVRGSYGSGYRHPNLVELYIGSPSTMSALAGNPDLDPETSHSFELGTNYDGEYIYIDLAGFFTTAKDYISTGDTEYVNIGGADTFGAELSVSVNTHFYGITPYSDLTFIREKYDYGSGNDVEDTWKSGEPVLRGRYGVRQSQKFGEDAVLDSDLYSRFASKAETEYSGGTEEEYDAWGILCFRTGLSYKDILSIYTGVNNIFDKEYEPVGELTAPGRSFFIGAGYSF